MSRVLECFYRRPSKKNATERRAQKLQIQLHSLHRAFRSGKLSLILPWTLLLYVALNVVRAFRWHQSFPDKKVIIWNADLHAGPIGCNLDMFEELGIKVHAEINFPNCKYFNYSDGRDVCAPPSRYIGICEADFGLEPCPYHRKQQISKRLNTHPAFLNANTVMCSHPIANCELYASFKKHYLLYVTTRLEFGRFDDYIPWRTNTVREYDVNRWFEWADNFKRIARYNRVPVLANNMYDAKYIEYLTGVEALVLPSWCGKGEISTILRNKMKSQSAALLTPYRSNLDFDFGDPKYRGWPTSQTKRRKTLHHELFDSYWAMNSRFDLVTIKEAFPTGYPDMRSFQDFPAVFFIPYQASTMFFFELYRTNVPIFVPSKRLLKEWIFKYNIMWETVYGNPPRSTSRNFNILPPNSFDPRHMTEWLQYYDVYQTETFPHLIYFDSWEHANWLFHQNIPFDDTVQRMAAHNRAEYTRIKGLWSSIFQELKRSDPHPKLRVSTEYTQTRVVTSCKDASINLPACPLQGHTT